MIESRMNRFRYRLGDAMGSRAPEYFQRRTPDTGWMIGGGGLLVALGIGYLALRLADKRLRDVIDRLTPALGENGHMPRRWKRTPTAATFDESRERSAGERSGWSP